MKRLILAAFAVMTTLVAAPGASAECIKVIGTESAGTAATMDPAFSNINDDAYQQDLIYNKLVNIDPNFQPVPELAKSWSLSKDGKTWTFKLQTGVTFHDGSAFTAADVVYTFKRLLDPAVGSPGAGLLSFLDPAGIVAVDDDTVTFTTKDVIAELPTLIANKYTLIVPEGATSKGLKSNGIGTGPFKQDVYDLAQNRRVFKRNKSYWKAGLPKAECIDLNVISEELSRVAAIKSGAADLIVSAGAASMKTMKGDNSLKLVPAASAGGYLTMSMWTDTPPFDDVRVRQALKAVIDRQQVVDTVLLGNGIVGNDNPVPPTNPAAYLTEAKPRDVKKAKALLAEAGYPNGLTVELNTAEAGPGMILLAQVYQQMAAEAGITVNIVNNPADSYWDTVWMKKPFFISSWTGRGPSEGLAYTFTSNAKYNEAKWKDADFDALVFGSRTETDPVKRAQMLKDAQKELSEKGGVIVPVFFLDVAVLRAACDGYTPHPSATVLNFETLNCSDR